MHVHNQSYGVHDCAINNVNVGLLDLDYSYYSSQERIVVAVFSIIFILTTTIISILLGLGVISTVAGGVLYASLLTLISLVCIIGIFVRHTMQHKGARTLAQQGWGHLRKSDINFLTKLSQCSSSINTNIQKQIRFFVIPKNRFVFSITKEDIQARIESVLEQAIQLIGSWITVLSSCEDSIREALRKEIANLFVPKWTSSSSDAVVLPLLQKGGQLFKEHAFADFIILLIQTPSVPEFIVGKLLQMACTWKNKYGSCKQKVIKVFKLINVWCLGYYLQANNQEILAAYDSTLLSEEMKTALEQGNFIHLLLQLVPDNLQLEVKNLLQDIDYQEFSATYSVSPLNSRVYINRNAYLKEALEELQESLAFIDNLPSADSKWFLFSFSMNYNKFNQLLDCFLKHHLLFMENPFLSLEFFKANQVLQAFLRSVIGKIMPIQDLGSLIKPLIIGLFASDTIYKEEKQMLVQRLGVSEEEFLNMLEQMSLLESLLPKLFA